MGHIGPVLRPRYIGTEGAPTKLLFHSTLSHNKDMWHQYRAQYQNIHTILAHLDMAVQQQQSTIIPETPPSITYNYHMKVFGFISQFI